MSAITLDAQGQLAEKTSVELVPLQELDGANVRDSSDQGEVLLGFIGKTQEIAVKILDGINCSFTKLTWSARFNGLLHRRIDCAQASFTFVGLSLLTSVSSILRTVPDKTLFLHGLNAFNAVQCARKIHSQRESLIQIAVDQRQKKNGPEAITDRISPLILDSMYPMIAVNLTALTLQFVSFRSLESLVLLFNILSATYSDFSNERSELMKKVQQWSSSN